MIFRNGEKNIDLKIIPIWRVRWETSLCVKRSLMVTNTFPTLMCGVDVGNSASSCAFLSYIHSQGIGVPRSPPFWHGTMCTAKWFEYTPWAWNIFLQKGLIMALRRPRALQLLWKKADYWFVLYNCGSMCEVQSTPCCPCAYTQKLLHTNAFRHTPFYTTDVFAHRRCYTHKRFHTRTPWHKYIFAHRRFWTNKRLYTKNFFYTLTIRQMLWNTEDFCRLTAFIHRDGYTQTLSHTEAVALRHKHMFLTYRQFSLDTNAFQTDMFMQLYTLK